MISVFPKNVTSVRFLQSAKANSPTETTEPGIFRETIASFERHACAAMYFTGIPSIFSGMLIVFPTKLKPSTVTSPFFTLYWIPLSVSLTAPAGSMRQRSRNNTVSAVFFICFPPYRSPHTGRVCFFCILTQLCAGCNNIIVNYPFSP
ncbi:unknown [Candidatus Colimorpha enterica]|uniref:Uncharacterized protein n=1 Tax=Candidatus Colimorpha enterica TaxID=3083063 RepID=R6TPS0_9BACT|nr:unknown [Candidatus Colimorpha enterica]